MKSFVINSVSSFKRNFSERQEFRVAIFGISVFSLLAIPMIINIVKELL